MAATTTTTAAQAKSSGSGLTFLLPLLLVGAVFVFMRRGRQSRQAAAGRPTVGIGDRVQTAGGIRGTVVDIEGDEVRVEVAPGVVMSFVARAVGAAPASAAPSEPLAADEPIEADEHTGADDAHDPGAGHNPFGDVGPDEGGNVRPVRHDEGGEHPPAPEGP